MAKKTIKDLEIIIKELEEKLKDQNNINLELNRTIVEMQERGDTSFLNSSLHKQLLRENRTLKAVIDSKDRIIKCNDKKTEEQLKEIEKLRVENSRLNGELGRQICEKGELRQEIESLNKKISLDQEFYKDNDNIKKKLDETLILSTRKSVKISELEAEIQNLKCNNKDIQKIKNERGAGRKERFTEQEKETIRRYRLQGKSMREISEIYKCSVGLIHKLINENN